MLLMQRDVMWCVFFACETEKTTKIFHCFFFSHTHLLSIHLLLLLLEFFNWFQTLSWARISSDKPWKPNKQRRFLSHTHKQKTHNKNPSDNEKSKRRRRRRERISERDVDFFGCCLVVVVCLVVVKITKKRHYKMMMMMVEKYHHHHHHNENFWFGRCYYYCLFFSGLGIKKLLLLL